MDSTTLGNEVLSLVGFLDAVVDPDRKHYKNPPGEDSHAGDCFRNQTGKQRPSAAENEVQDGSGDEVDSDLRGRKKGRPKGNHVRCGGEA